MHHIEEIIENGGPIEDYVVMVKARLVKLMDIMKQMLVQQHSQLYREEVSVFFLNIH